MIAVASAVVFLMSACGGGGDDSADAICSGTTWERWQAHAEYAGVDPTCRNYIETEYAGNLNKDPKEPVDTSGCEGPEGCVGEDPDGSAYADGHAQPDDANGCNGYGGGCSNGDGGSTYTNGNGGSTYDNGKADPYGTTGGGDSYGGSGNGTAGGFSNGGY